MLTVALALGVLTVPGCALLLALDVRRAVPFVALAPSASLGVASMTATGTAVLGVRFGPGPLTLVTVALVVVAVVRSRGLGGPPRVRMRAAVMSRLRVRPAPVELLVGLALVVVALGVSTLTWMRGLGSLTTILQEHDMIHHGIMTSYIQRTGEAGAWQLMPTDVLTGTNVSFYPSGMHQVMAVVGSLRGGPVVGVNAVTVVALAIGWVSGSAMLGFVAARRARLAPGHAALAAGVAAIVAAGLYRPAVSLVQWGGILGNAITLSLTPGVLVGLLSLRRRAWGHAAAAGVGAAGLFAVHPTFAATLGVSLGAWSLGEASTGPGREWLRQLIRPAALAFGVLGLVALPTFVSLFDQDQRISAVQPDIAPAELSDAVERTVGLTYNTGDPAEDVSQRQTAAVILTLLGVGTVVATRRGLGLLGAWLGWVVIVVAAWVRPGRAPQSLVTNIFYDAQTRVWSHVSLFVPALAGLGLVVACLALVAAPRRLWPAWPGWRRRWLRGLAHRGLRGPVTVGLVVALVLAYLAVPGRSYARTNFESIASRYRSPIGVLRFSDDDRRAAQWLAARMEPGQRVLNSSNDGSGLLYMQEGLPIVNILSMGDRKDPATYGLMAGFNRYPDDPEIRGMLEDHDVAWVYVDEVAPEVFLPGAPESWIGWMGVAPGLTNLDGLPGLRLAYRSGTVSVYKLDLDAADDRGIV